MHFCILLYLARYVRGISGKLLSTLFRREGNSVEVREKKEWGGGEERWLMRLLTVAYIFPNE